MNEDFFVVRLCSCLRVRSVGQLEQNRAASDAELARGDARQRDTATHKIEATVIKCNLLPSLDAQRPTDRLRVLARTRSLAACSPRSHHPRRRRLLCAAMPLRPSTVFFPEMALTLVRRSSAKLPFNHFMFRTDPRWTKNEIKEYLDKVYGVTVARITTYIAPGEPPQRPHGGGGGTLPVRMLHSAPAPSHPRARARLRPPPPPPLPRQAS